MVTECSGLGCGSGSWFGIIITVVASAIILGLLVWVISKINNEAKGE